jgi:hypothetical protein
MKSKSAWALLPGLLAAAAALAVGTARADVSQTPVATACPAAYELLSVTALEAEAPYKLPRLVDTAGNGNGWVCGFPLPDAYRDADCRTGGTIACILEQLGLPVYHFTDDDNPASKKASAAG